jgi:hypothetical protein
MSIGIEINPEIFEKAKWNTANKIKAVAEIGYYSSYITGEKAGLLIFLILLVTIDSQK